MSLPNLMQVAGIGVRLHLPPASRSQMEGGQEVALHLPPYAPRQVYDLADFPRASDDWIRARGRAEKSYFFGIPRDRADGYGMWLDFQGLDEDPMEVAAMVSMQGVNLLTLEDFEENKTLMWYRDGEKCPRHPGSRFHNGLFCELCGYRWPKVNFLSTTGAREDHATLWVDGPLEGSETVRQFWFVPGDSRRGIAQNLIGERRAQGIGILLYRSVEPKQRRSLQNLLDMPKGSGEVFRGGEPELAAGARIKQRIGADPNGSDFWHPHWVGVIRIYFDWQDRIDEILRQHQTGSGPMSGGRFPVGNLS